METHEQPASRVSRLASRWLAFATLALVLLTAGSARAALPQNSPIGKRLGNYSAIDALRIQAGGKILVAGATQDCDQYGGSCSNRYLFVARFRSSGKSDLGFGGGDGIVRIPISTGYAHPHAVGLLIDDQGGIVTGAGTNTGVTGVTLVRLLADGAPDLDFGLAGVAEITVPDFYVSGFGTNLAQLENGDAVVGGSDASGEHPRLAAVAIRPDGGGLDRSFGGDGLASVAISSAPASESASVALFGPAGHVLLFGQTHPDHDSGAKAVVEFDDSGAAVRTTRFDDVADALPLVAAGIMLPAGDVVLSGTTPPALMGIDHGACSIATLDRLSAGGVVDNGFPAAGTPSVCGDAALAVVGKHRLMLASYVSGYGTPSRITVTRLFRSGALDPRFNSGELRSFRVAGESSTGTAVASMPDRSTVVAARVFTRKCALDGQARWTYCTALALVKLKPSGVIDRAFGANGLITAPSIHLCPSAPTKGCPER